MSDSDARVVHAELLVGRRVVDPHGKHVGRIEEMIAVRERGECYVTEFHLGAAALLERLAMTVTDLFTPGRSRRLVVVPWDQMDLSDPTRPRALCPKGELETR